MGLPVASVEFSPTTGPFATPSWVDLSARVLEAEWADGKQADLSEYPPGQATIVLDNSDRVLDPEHAAGPYYGLLNPRVPFRIRATERATVLTLTGAANSWATTPPHAALNVVGDIDIRARIAPTDWTPAASQTIINRFFGSVGYNLYLPNTGRPSFQWIDGGGATATRAATVATGFTDGTAHWVRVTLDVDNGAAGHDVKFWTSDDGATWTQLGATVTTAGVTAIGSGSLAASIGRNAFSGALFVGDIHRVEVRDGIDGTKVVDFVADDLTSGQTVYNDRAGRVWTLQAAARVTTAAPAQINVDGTAGTCISSFGNAPDPTTDLDVIVYAAAADWTPAATQYLATNHAQIAATTGWSLRLTSSGVLNMVTGNGAAAITHNSTVATGLADGTAKWVRATVDVDNGAGGHDVKFYLSDNGTTWTPLGATVTTAGVTTIAANTNGWVLGADGLLNNRFAGAIRYAEIRHAIDGAAVGYYDARAMSPGGPGTFTDAYGNYWRPLGTGWTITVPATADTRDLFYGFVEDGWEQGQSPPAVATCTVKLVDLLGILSGYTLPSVFGAKVTELGALAYWPLDEGANATAVADKVGTKDGTVVGEVVLGSDSLGTGLGTSALFNGTDTRIDIDRSWLWEPSVAGWTVVALIATTTAGDADTMRPIWMQVAGNNSSDIQAVFVDLNGQVQRYSFRGGSGVAYRSLPVVTDGDPHLVIAQRDGVGTDYGVAVDTAVLHTATTAAFTQSGNGVAIGGTPLAAKNYDDNYFNGRIGHVAAWPRALTLAEREELVTARASLNLSRSGAQIGWALDQIGVPAGMRDLDAGAQIMGPAVTMGVDALAFMREVTATEQGDLYVAHHDGGKLRFRDRYASFQDTRSTSVQATFSDDDTVADTAATRVDAGSLVVEPNGVSSIINQATVSWVGGEETWDESTGSPYGPRGYSVTTQAPNPLTARGIGQWIVANNSVPAAKIKALGVDPGSNPTEFPTALGVRVGDRVAYRSHPQSVGAATTKALEVLGRRHTIAGVEWRTMFYLTEHPDNGIDLFTLGVSQLGGTHILAF